jgi:uncharacterized membrane protein
MTLLTTELFLKLAGALVLTIAATIARDAAHPRRWGSAIFWALVGVALVGGKQLSPLAVGYGVLVMAALAATKQVAAPRFVTPESAFIAAETKRLGHLLIWPVLLVPAIAIGSALVLPQMRTETWAVALPREISQVGIGIGCVYAVTWALRVTRERPRVAIEEGGRLLQLLGWTLLLPPLLAALGGVFAKAGVGEIIAEQVAAVLPMRNPLIAVIAYGGGMALFTILLGNAFAAFPVITLGVGLPFIVKEHGGNPAIMGALGMLSGYCGTLVTPMAANFNIVPARLLELSDDYAVIKAQAPMAAAIWVFNIALMYLCVYRF